MVWPKHTLVMPPGLGTENHIKELTPGGQIFGDNRLLHNFSIVYFNFAMLAGQSKSYFPNVNVSYRQTTSFYFSMCTSYRLLSTQHDIETHHSVRHQYMS